jgi:hypothetical protein
MALIKFPSPLWGKSPAAAVLDDLKKLQAMTDAERAAAAAEAMKVIEDEEADETSEQ